MEIINKKRWETKNGVFVCLDNRITLNGSYLIIDDHPDKRNVSDIHDIISIKDNVFFITENTIDHYKRNDSFSSHLNHRNTYKMNPLNGYIFSTDDNNVFSLIIVSDNNIKLIDAPGWTDVDIPIIFNPFIGKILDIKKYTEISNNDKIFPEIKMEISVSHLELKVSATVYNLYIHSDLTIEIDEVENTTN